MVWSFRTSSSGATSSEPTAWFAQSGVETLLVDLDPQASATRHVGLDPAALDTTLTDVLIDPSRGIAPAVRATRYPALSILPAHESLGTLESELASMPDRESLLAEAWSGDLPYRVDIVDWHAIDERFRRLIEAERVALTE